jgi:hypothetical protein
MSGVNANTVARRPFTGSCHCGAINYIVYISMPTKSSSPVNLDTFKAMKQFVYKCNCTTCQKMGLLHLRPPHAPTDFMLLQPKVDPKGNAEGLGVYRCNDEDLNFTFCTNCGVRCFIYAGEWENTISSVPTPESIATQSLEVSKPRAAAAAEEGQKRYLSVNMHTLDANQAGLDLRQWHEKGWIFYMNWFDDDPHLPRAERHALKPFLGGMY